MAEYREPPNNIFLEAINQPINRESVPRVDETVLINNRVELTKQLEPAHILNSLFQRRVIDSDDFDSIKQEERQHGRRSGVEKLLRRIHFSGPDGLDKFIDSLKDMGYPRLANRLQKSRQIIRNRAEQETPNESLEKTLQELRQTIKKTEQDTPNKNCVKEKNYSHKFEITEKGSAAESTTNDTRCIILLGMSRVGKSSLGNYLLGTQKFDSSIYVNEECQIERTDQMELIDTPGLFSWFRSDATVAREIMNTIRENKLLINVYILVLSVEERLSGEQLESVEFIKKLFGENVINNMIIVFTGKYLVKDDPFQFPRCLPQLPYFILDCEHLKQEEAEEIRKEIFSQKYQNIPDVFDVDHVDWAAIETKDRRRKDSKILDVGAFVDSEPGGKSSLKRLKGTVMKKLFPYLGF